MATLIFGLLLGVAATWSAMMYWHLSVIDKRDEREADK